MTPSDASATRGVDATTTAPSFGAAASAPSIEFPSLSETLARLRGDAATRSELPTSSFAPGDASASNVDGPVPFSIAAALLEDEHGEARAESQSHTVTPYVELSEAIPVADLAPIVHEHWVPLDHAVRAPGADPDADGDDLDLDTEPMASLWSLLRASLRSRIIAFGEARHHRSAYEWVFLMLAFAVMVLLAAPPLVDIFLAINGVKP